MINVIYADSQAFDNPQLAEEFAARGIQVQTECANTDEVLDAVKQQQPDVILVSLALGGLGAFEAITQLKMHYPRIGIVIMMIHSNGLFPKRLLGTGAAGFVTMESNPADIAAAVSTVNAGEKFISPEVAQKIAVSLLPGGKDSPLDRLSEREMQVMLQLSLGESPQHISSRLSLSPKTVSTYKHRVRDKLRVDDTQEIYALAGSHGLVAR